MNSILLPERYPNRDLFVLDVEDVVPKSDMTSMAYPLYSLSTRRDMRRLRYDHKGLWLEVSPSSKGLATFFDKDFLIYCTSKIVHLKNKGLTYSQWDRVTTHNFLDFTNRWKGGIMYRRTADLLARLHGTKITTNIFKGSAVTGFGLIEWYDFKRRGSDNPDGETFIDVKLSDWLFQAIESLQVLPLNRRYFHIRRPVHRALYLLARKHCADQPAWPIGGELLQQKIGALRENWRFMAEIGELAECGGLLDYNVRVKGSTVVFSPKGRLGRRSGYAEAPAKLAPSPKRARRIARPAQPALALPQSGVVTNVDSSSLGAELQGALSSFGETLQSFANRSIEFDESERVASTSKRVAKSKKSPPVSGRALGAPARRSIGVEAQTARGRVVISEKALEQAAAIAPHLNKLELERRYILWAEKHDPATHSESARFLKWVKTMSGREQAER